MLAAVAPFLLRVATTPTPTPTPAPQRVSDLLTTPEMLGALAALFLAVAGALTAFMRWLKAYFDARLTSVAVNAAAAASAAQESEQASKVAAQAAKGAHEGVTNNHSKNLRDDLDERFSAVLARLDSMEEATQRSEDLRERRDRRSEDQIDGLRDDVRALTERSDREQRRVHEKIDVVSQDLMEVHERLDQISPPREQ